MSLGEILGHDSEQFYLLKYYGSADNLEIQLESYSIDSLKLKGSYPLDLYYEKGDEFNVEVTWMVDDIIWIFTTHFKRRDNILLCYSQQFNMDGSTRSEKLLIDRITIDNRKELGNFDFILGVDRSVTMMVYSPPVDKYE